MPGSVTAPPAGRLPGRPGVIALCAGNMRAALAVFRRDWTVFQSYRGNLIGHFLSSLWVVCMVRFGSRLVHVPMFHTSDAYFGFAVVGIGTLQVLGSTLTSPPESLRQELVAGTFERLVLSPFGAVRSTMSMMVFPVLYALVTCSITLAIAVVGFGLALHWSTVPLAIPVAMLGALAFMPFGLVIAAATLAFKQAARGTRYVLAAVGLLGGFYVPISLLPAWIRWTADVQPLTPSVELIRHLLLGTPTPQPPWLDVAKLVGFALVLVPMSTLLLTGAVEFGRRRGTISEY